VRRGSLVATALVGIATALSTSVASHAAPSPMRFGKPVRMQVTHTTRVQVPGGVARLTVVHAKPLDRTWPGLGGPLVVEKATFAPEGATEAPTRSASGFHWTWNLKSPTAGETDFVSRFELTSVDRELDTSGLKVRWADLEREADGLRKGLPPLPEPTAELEEVVAKVRKGGKDVLDVLVALSQWIGRSIAYTPGVSYGTQDVAAICRGRAGHCGHRATVFLALCNAAGIPARRVAGYALLNVPAGGTGADDTNKHVWVEVNLPSLGWVELDPGSRGSPFALPHAYVQSPVELQSYFVEANSAAGEPSRPVLSDRVAMRVLK
jgi:transglutaminase-like putative cysteine protease